MQSIIRSNEINNHESVKEFFYCLDKLAKDREGYLYYKYPMSATDYEHIPDIVIADKTYGITIFNFYEWYEKDINEIEEEFWVINGEERDSPFLVLDDYATELGNNFQKQRLLRNKIEINRIVVLPLINRENEIVMSKLTKFSNPENETIILGSTDKLVYEELFKNKANLEGELADLFISVVQGAGSLNSVKRIVKEEKSNKIGDAIKNISHKINVLAEEQHLAAIQIPDPQKIRLSRMDEMDETTAYMELIRENIDYDIMMSDKKWSDREMYDELYELICDVVCVPRKTIRIAGEDYPYNLVKSKFLKLNSQHLEYVIGCMKNNTTKVSNIKAYLTTALYNAPNTINHYYTAEVNHDMYGTIYPEE